MMQPGDMDVVRSHGERQQGIEHCAQLHLVCFRYIVIGGYCWASLVVKSFYPVFSSLACRYARIVLIEYIRAMETNGIRRARLRIEFKLEKIHDRR